MANTVRVKEESFRLSATWTIEPFASVLHQCESSIQCFESPTFETRWNVNWQIKLQFIPKLPYAAVIHLPYTEFYNVSRQAAVPNAVLDCVIGNKPKFYELRTTLMNPSDAGHFKCFNGRHLFFISVDSSNPLNRNNNEFIIHNCSKLNSKLFIESHRSNDWLHMEKLQLSVKITFYPDLCAESSSLTFNVNERLATLKEAEGLHDVTILVNGQELKANKTVLALISPVFFAMFTHEFKEKHEQRINIEDTDVRTIETLINFAYTGQSPNFINLESAVKLFRVADKYEVSSLKEICIRHLRAVTVDENRFIELLLSFQV